jgi:GntR family transcriptional regulator
MLEHSAHTEHPDRKGTSDSWFAEVRRGGRTPSQDFAFRIVPATPGIAKRLRIQPDDLVAVRECFRYVDELPWSIQTSYYPFGIAQAANIATPQDVEEGTVRRLAAHGFREVGWSDEVSCRPATADEVRAFDLARGVSVIVYTRVGWTAEQPIRVTREILPADRNVVMYESGDLAAMHAAEKADAEVQRGTDPVTAPA